MTGSNVGQKPQRLSELFLELGMLPGNEPEPNIKSQPTKQQKKKRSSPFSLRLSFEERAQLERESGRMSLGAYIKSRLFSGKKTPKRSRPKNALKDEQALAQVLSALGRSGISKSLAELSKASKEGRLLITGEADEGLREACQAVITMRDHLITALGLHAE